MAGPVAHDELDVLQAKAHEINKVGVAQAAAILAKGDAEAKVQQQAIFVHLLVRVVARRDHSRLLS